MAAFRPRWWSEITRRTPAEPPSAQRRGTRSKSPVLGVADVDAEHLTVAVLADTGGDDHRTRDHLVGHAALQVGGVQEDVGERDVVERRSRKAASSSSSPPQIRLTSDLEIPESTPSASTRSSTLRVETPWT